MSIYKYGYIGLGISDIAISKSRTGDRYVQTDMSRVKNGYNRNRDIGTDIPRPISPPINMDTLVWVYRFKSYIGTGSGDRLPITDMSIL